MWDSGSHLCSSSLLISLWDGGATSPHIELSWCFLLPCLLISLVGHTKWCHHDALDLVLSFIICWGSSIRHAWIVCLLDWQLVEHIRLTCLAMWSCLCQMTHFIMLIPFSTPPLPPSGKHVVNHKGRPSSSIMAYIPSQRTMWAPNPSNYVAFGLTKNSSYDHLTIHDYTLIYYGVARALWHVDLGILSSTKVGGTIF